MKHKKLAIFSIITLAFSALAGIFAFSYRPVTLETKADYEPNEYTQIVKDNYIFLEKYSNNSEEYLYFNYELKLKFTKLTTGYYEVTIQDFALNNITAYSRYTSTYIFTYNKPVTIDLFYSTYQTYETQSIEDDIQITIKFDEFNIDDGYIITQEWQIKLDDKTTNYKQQESFELIDYQNPQYALGDLTGYHEYTADHIITKTYHYEPSIEVIYDSLNVEYNKGFNEGIAEGEQNVVVNPHEYDLFTREDLESVEGMEVIDLPGLMLQVLSMPFTFINKAFDVTIFPNTPYQINFANIIKGMIAILTMLFIFNLFKNGLGALGDVNDKREDRNWKREERQMKREKHEKDMNK